MVPDANRCTVIHMHGSIEEVEERVTAALKAVGFGIVTRIDAKATFKVCIGSGAHPCTCWVAVQLSSQWFSPSCLSHIDSHSPPHAHAHTHSHIHTYTYTHTDTHRHTTLVHTLTHTRAHTHTHACTHLYTHARAPTQAKIDAEFKPCVILGACNPHLALKGLTAHMDVGLLLPCNVMLETPDAAHSPKEQVVRYRSLFIQRASVAE
jgi:uncharacterized protein (DUF302 family)